MAILENLGKGIGYAVACLWMVVGLGSCVGGFVGCYFALKAVDASFWAYAGSFVGCTFGGICVFFCGATCCSIVVVVVVFGCLKCCCPDDSQSPVHPSPSSTELDVAQHPSVVSILKQIGEAKRSHLSAIGSFYDELKSRSTYDSSSGYCSVLSSDSKSADRSSRDVPNKSLHAIRLSLQAELRELRDERGGRTLADVIREGKLQVQQREEEYQLLVQEARAIIEEKLKLKKWREAALSKLQFFEDLTGDEDGLQCLLSTSEQNERTREAEIARVRLFLDFLPEVQKVNDELESFLACPRGKKKRGVVDVSYSSSPEVDEFRSQIEELRNQIQKMRSRFLIDAVERISGFEFVPIFDKFEALLGQNVGLAETKIVEVSELQTAKQNCGELQASLREFEDCYCGQDLLSHIDRMLISQRKMIEVAQLTAEALETLREMRRLLVNGLDQIRVGLGGSDDVSVDFGAEFQSFCDHVLETDEETQMQNLQEFCEHLLHEIVAKSETTTASCTSEWEKVVEIVGRMFDGLFRQPEKSQITPAFGGPGLPTGRRKKGVRGKKKGGGTMKVGRKKKGGRKKSRGLTPASTLAALRSLWDLALDTVQRNPPPLGDLSVLRSETMVQVVTEMRDGKMHGRCAEIRNDKESLFIGCYAKGVRNGDGISIRPDEVISRLWSGKRFVPRIPLASLQPYEKICEGLGIGKWDSRQVLVCVPTLDGKAPLADVVTKFNEIPESGRLCVILGVTSCSREKEEEEVGEGCAEPHAESLILQIFESEFVDAFVSFKKAEAQEGEEELDSFRKGLVGVFERMVPPDPNEWFGFWSRRLRHLERWLGVPNLLHDMLISLAKRQRGFELDDFVEGMKTIMGLIQNGSEDLFRALVEWQEITTNVESLPTLLRMLMEDPYYYRLLPRLSKWRTRQRLLRQNCEVKANEGVLPLFDEVRQLVEEGKMINERVESELRRRISVWQKAHSLWSNLVREVLPDLVRRAVRWGTQFLLHSPCSPGRNPSKQARKTGLLLKQSGASKSMFSHRHASLGPACSLTLPRHLIDAATLRRLSKQILALRDHLLKSMLHYEKETKSMMRDVRELEAIRIVFDPTKKDAFQSVLETWLDTERDIVVRNSKIVERTYASFENYHLDSSAYVIPECSPKVLVEPVTRFRVTSHASTTFATEFLPSEDIRFAMGTCKNDFQLVQEFTDDRKELEDGIKSLEQSGRRKFPQLYSSVASFAQYILENRRPGALVVLIVIISSPDKPSASYSETVDSLRPFVDDPTRNSFHLFGVGVPRVDCEPLENFTAQVLGDFHDIKDFNSLQLNFEPFTLMLQAKVRESVEEGESICVDLGLLLDVSDSMWKEVIPNWIGLV